MISEIKQRLGLTRQPVAFLLVDERPPGVLEFDEEKWGCVVALLGAASAGRTVLIGHEALDCMLQGRGRCHSEPRPGSLPHYDVPQKYGLLKPLDLVDPQSQTPELACMLVDADQLAALITLANHDRGGESAVVVPGAIGCHAVYLLPYHEARQEHPRAVIGLTDPVSRQYIDKGLLAFSIPWPLFCSMESQAGAVLIPPWSNR